MTPRAAHYSLVVVDERRVTCWACGKKIKPDKAPRALCPSCAYGGYFGAA